jgi:methylenetetrahydrofolate reductase (NADPH)
MIRTDRDPHAHGSVASEGNGMDAALAVYEDQWQQVVDFMAGFSLEVTPGAAAAIADFREVLRPGCTVYITALPGADFEDTISVARRLSDQGFNAVPHLSARSIPDLADFARRLQRITAEAGVTQVLLIGGAIANPVGDISDTMQLLATGLFDKHGIRRIGIAGHPEGSPDIPDEAIAAALRWKNDYARRTGAELYLVTQFCFEAEPIIKWDRIIQAEGNRLPIHVGIPGLATVKTLLAHARACGIGPSMRFLTKQAMNVTRLLTVSAPDRLVRALASHQANHPSCGIRAAHVYPLGGLRKSAQWSYAVVDGRFELDVDGKGFTVGPLG